MSLKKKKKEKEIITMTIISETDLRMAIFVMVIGLSGVQFGL